MIRRGALGAVLAGAACCPGAAAQSPPAADAAWTLDLTHTFVTLEARRFGLSTTRARFDRKQGTLHFDRAARQSRVTIEVETASLSTGSTALDAQLKGAAFLDAAQHPSARFVAERMVFDGANVATVPGVLTLRGISHPVTLAATTFSCYLNPIFRREVCGGDFVATVASSRWGIGPRPALGLPDEIRLVVQVEAISP